MSIKNICLFGLFGLVGCTSSDAYLELPYGSPDKIITISEDTFLDRNYEGVQFKVINGAMLFAGSFTLDGRTNNGRNSFAIVELIDGSKLIGGNLKYGRGGAVISATLPKDWKKKLIALPQSERIAYINSIRESLDYSCSTVTDTNFYQNRNSIYIKTVTPCAKITNVNIKYGRLGIYHDAYSQNALVSHSLFDSVGRNYFSSKNTGGYFEYKSSRESVAIDGSSGNRYENNTFINGAKNAVNLYVNCGEQEPDGSEGMPREEPAKDNVFIGNTFENFKLAIHNGSRHPNRKTYPCRADDQGDRVIDTVIKGNTFKNVARRVSGYEFIN